MKDKEKTIYNLELHEYLNLDGNYQILRVHGGFLYNYHNAGYNMVTSTFVPYDDSTLTVTGEIDFLPKKKRNEKKTN